MYTEVWEAPLINNTNSWVAYSEISFSKLPVVSRNLQLIALVDVNCGGPETTLSETWAYCEDHPGCIKINMWGILETQLFKPR